MSRKIAVTIVAVITRTIEVSDDEDSYYIERNVEYQGLHTGESDYEEFKYQDFDKITVLVTELYD